VGSGEQRSTALFERGLARFLDGREPDREDALVTRFRIDVDTKLSRRQRRRLQEAAFRWRMQMDSKKIEAPWRQDWGVQYECEAASEAAARERVVGALGEDLGDRLIVTQSPLDS